MSQEQAQFVAPETIKGFFKYRVNAATTCAICGSEVPAHVVHECFAKEEGAWTPRLREKVQREIADGFAELGNDAAATAANLLLAGKIKHVKVVF